MIWTGGARKRKDILQSKQQGATTRTSARQKSLHVKTVALSRTGGIRRKQTRKRAKAVSDLAFLDDFHMRGLPATPSDDVEHPQAAPAGSEQQATSRKLAGIAGGDATVPEQRQALTPEAPKISLVRSDEPIAKRRRVASPQQWEGAETATAGRSDDGWLDKLPVAAPYITIDSSTAEQQVPDLIDALVAETRPRDARAHLSRNPFEHQSFERVLGRPVQTQNNFLGTDIQEPSAAVTASSRDSTDWPQQWDAPAEGGQAWPHAARHDHHRAYNEGTGSKTGDTVRMHGHLPTYASQANRHVSEQRMQEGRAPPPAGGHAPPGSFIDDGVLFMDVSSDPSKCEEGRGSASALGLEHGKGEQGDGATARMESQERNELVQSAARIARELRDAGSSADGTVDSTAAAMLRDITDRAVSLDYGPQAVAELASTIEQVGFSRSSHRTLLDAARRLGHASRKIEGNARERARRSVARFRGGQLAAASTGPNQETASSSSSSSSSSPSLALETGAPPRESNKANDQASMAPSGHQGVLERRFSASMTAAGRSSPSGRRPVSPLHPRLSGQPGGRSQGHAAIHSQGDGMQRSQWAVWQDEEAQQVAGQQGGARAKPGDRAPAGPATRAITAATNRGPWT